jgi:N-methylhydantoinase A
LSTFKVLSEEAESRLVSQGASQEDIRFKWNLDMRYVGQSHEISVEISEEQQKKIVEKSISGFEHVHNESFGYKMSGRDVEWVTARIIAESSSGQFRPLIHSVNEIAQPISERSVLLGDGSKISADVYRRWELAAGQVVMGPSIIEQLDTTTYVGPDWSATQEKDGVLWMRREKK